MVSTAGKQAEIAPAMDKSKASGATALNVLSGPLFSFNRRVVIERAAALRLPAIYEWPEIAEEGGLIAYGPRLPLMYRQAARLVAKVLQGVKPQDIPVELPSKFDLVVNLATAKALGLTIPESFIGEQGLPAVVMAPDQTATWQQVRATSASLIGHSRSSARLAPSSK